ncbi:hypothetical protein LARV_00976 [Longilinea arvoryzae]|uniref:Uncharacterized protein n=1 Tax=Longilinea arvoryzae TaxID=360412 RepID=A0A0S7BD54_9CHLR|nr:hypothetical protein [Longilinea arvoryzae]GAP13225.1 hypothetical protein LARV_00976 [Longilinea arvoryzae]
MDCRQIVEAAYDNKPIPSEIATTLDGIIYRTSHELASAISKYSIEKNNFGKCYISPQYLKDTALEFHTKAGTLTESVLENIQNLNEDTPILRFSHQPNLFSSWGIVTQFIFNASVAEKLSGINGSKPAQIYIIVDYDVAEDSRFRVSHYPTPNMEGGSYILSGVVNKIDYDKPIWMISKPDKDLIKKWLQHLRILLHQELQFLRKHNINENRFGTLQQHLQDVEEVIWQAYDCAATLAEFNAIFLSKIVNNYWGLPTLFIPGHKLHRVMREAFELCIELLPKINELANEGIKFYTERNIYIKTKSSNNSNIFPIWYLCQKCNRRVGLFIESNNPLIVKGKCSSCSSIYHIYRPDKTSIDVEKFYESISPRILIDNLLDVIAINTYGSTGYIGQAEHILLTNYVARALGWRIPPQSIWRPYSSNYCSGDISSLVIIESNSKKELIERANCATKLSFLSKGSLLYYLVNYGWSDLYDSWKHYFDHGGKVNGIYDNAEGTPFSLSDDLIKKLRNMFATCTTDPGVYK